MKRKIIGIINRISLLRNWRVIRILKKFHVSFSKKNGFIYVDGRSLKASVLDNIEDILQAYEDIDEFNHLIYVENDYTTFFAYYNSDCIENDLY